MLCGTGLRRQHGMTGAGDIAHRHMRRVARKADLAVPVDEDDAAGTL